MKWRDLRTFSFLPHLPSNAMKPRPSFLGPAKETFNIRCASLKESIPSAVSEGGWEWGRVLPRPVYSQYLLLALLYRPLLLSWWTKQPLLSIA